jgi:hypothetical protein
MKDNKIKNNMNKTQPSIKKNMFSVLDTDSENECEKIELKKIEEIKLEDVKPNIRQCFENRLQDSNFRPNVTNKSNDIINDFIEVKKYNNKTSSSFGNRYNNFKDQDTENGWNSRQKKEPEFVTKKELYDEKKTYDLDLGNDKPLNSSWTVWIHRSTQTDWTLKGYEKIYVINSIGSFWRFFNNYNSFDKYNNQIFIMRGEISPIWEDLNNKFGGICSIKIDSLQKGGRTDISTEIMVLLSMLMINETLVKNSDKVNGISYSIKKKSVLIKIWNNEYSKDYDFPKDLPISMINKLNDEMEYIGKGRMHETQKVSIIYKPIKPEYELAT